MTRIPRRLTVAIIAITAFAVPSFTFAHFPRETAYMVAAHLTLGSSSPAGLGSAVAVSADGKTILAGAPYLKVHGQPSAGAAAAWTYNGSRWSKPVVLNMGSKARMGDGIGDAVAL